MPINTNLNTAPYYDDFDLENQYYRVLFKPGFALQARELTQLQSVLQSQIEQFGDNIFKEGSIVKGCNFTNLNDLQFVRLTDQTDFDPLDYISKRVIENDVEYDIVYQAVSGTGLVANIVSADRGFETRPPDLNTFYINYLGVSSGGNKVFSPGETLTINEYKYKVGVLEPSETNPVQSNLGVATIPVTTLIAATGNAFGVQSSPGIIFQKGHFLFADAQTLVVEKYSNSPDGKNVGYQIKETFISALQDPNLYDNANSSPNENAPGADRLQLIPALVVLDEQEAEENASFFSLIRYSGGNAVTLRDVSQYNVLGEEIARRTYEESGNYILQDFNIKTDRRGADAKALVSAGTAYVKGYRVESTAAQEFTVDPVVSTETQESVRIGIDYGSYIILSDMAGYIPLNFAPVSLRNSSNAVIGTAFVHNITQRRKDVVGQNGEIYLFGVRMSAPNNFSAVVSADSGQGSFTIPAGSVLKETRRSPFIFDTGMSNLFATSSTTIPIRSLVTGASNIGDTVTIDAPPGNDFALQQDDLACVDTNGDLVPVLGTTLSLNNTRLTVQLDSGFAGTVSLYYNENANNVSPQNKTPRETHVRASYSSSKKQYTLGLPDCYELISVTDINGVDVTNSFRLFTNQKDHYYDHSYIEYIAGSAEPAAGNMSIEFKVFELSQSTGEYFFTINSYPGGLTPSDIPVYDADNGQRFNLRECFDFRPYVNKLAAASYTATNPGTAPIINDTVEDNVPSFTNYGPPLIPASSAFAVSDIEYYFSRTDLITLSSYGKMELLKGEEEKNSVAPKVESDKLVIAELFVPGAPALTQQEALELGKPEYRIQAKAVGIHNYTMKDIRKIERKIEGMEYYISLNQLEQDTQNLSVTDSDGLNRFKNGFIVEPFNDLRLADVTNPAFNAAVRFNKKILTPSVKTFPLDLKYSASTNASIFSVDGDVQVATLSRNQNVSIINQPFATNARNCVSNFYKYVGLGFVSPPYDATQDTTVNPVQLDIDLATPINDFVDNIQELSPLTDSTTTTTGVDPRRGGGTSTTVTSSLVVSGEASSSQALGEFVTDFSMQPYMAPRDLKVFMSGLRPNTRHYFFFDKVDVNAFVHPGTPSANNVESIQRYGVKGAAVTTDALGVLRAVFSLPSGTFFVGERNLEIYDVALYTDIESASTSGGFVSYNAYNFSIEKSSLTATTRFPTFDTSQVTTVRNLPRRPIVRNDPLAQTFFIKDGMTKGSNAIYASQLDVYFKRKSAINGVTCQLREVLNGYPTSKIIPFSSIHFTADQVNVSDDASIATTFAFKAPVRLDAEKEYAFVIQPDANDPDYLIFTSKVGGLDLSPGVTQNQPIVQDWGDGVLFTSTNNRAWKSYQDEDVKFRLYRQGFNQKSGTVTLTNNDNEFLTVTQNSTQFTPGEKIYALKALQGSTQSTISMASGTNIITGSFLDETYQADEYIYVSQPGGSPLTDLFKILSVDSPTQMTTYNETPFAVSAGTGTPAVAGDLSYFNFRNPTEIQLEKSSATSAKAFIATDTIYGLDSGATAIISSIDDISISYFQPLINKTNDDVTKTNLTGRFTDPDNTLTPYTTTLKFADNNIFASKGALIYSKSNNTGGTYPFELIISLDDFGTADTSTPFIDIETSKLLGYQYKITNDSATTSTYIGKKIELASDLDAEDLQVILTGHKPAGSDIKVYARPQHEADSVKFDSVPWIEMELTEGIGVFASATNPDDYREYIFKIPAANKNASGELEYTTTAGTFTGYRKFAIKIELLSPNNYSVPTVKDFRGLALT